MEKVKQDDGGENELIKDDEAQEQNEGNGQSGENAETD